MANPDSHELRAPVGTFENVTNSEGGVFSGENILFGSSRSKYFMRVTPTEDRSSADVLIRIKEGRVYSNFITRDFRIDPGELITELRTARQSVGLEAEALPSIEQLLKEISLAKQAPPLR